MKESSIALSALAFFGLLLLCAGDLIADESPDDIIIDNQGYKTDRKKRK